MIRNLTNNKVYVGSSVNTVARLNKHVTTLRRGIHPNEYLQRAFSKSGEAEFQFYHLLDTYVENRLSVEQWWIDYFKSDQEEYGYNLIPTRASQLHGQAVSKLQIKRWYSLTKEERREKCKHLQDPQVRKRNAEVSRPSRQTEEYKQMRKEVASRTIATPEMRKYWSDKMKAKWQDPEFRAARLKGLAKGVEKINARAKAKRLGNEIV